MVFPAARRPADALLPRLGAWALLWLVTVTVYWGVWGHQFVNFDDPMFITENSHVIAGMTADSIHWAWTNKDALLWHPLAWMAHMAVSQFGGVRPMPHLLANFCLHCLNAGLLFNLFRSLTGSGWRSLAVALLFAVHPVNVETAAWASELKNTLSTFFLLLGLQAYIQRAATGRRFDGVVLGAFALSLLAKPMVIFFPAMLALLDYWPLRRFPGTSESAAWQRWMVEKIPYVIVAALLLGMTLLPWTSAAAPDMAPIAMPGWSRLAAVPCNYVRYLELLFWPADLAVLYPERLDHPAWEVAGSMALLVGISAAAWTVRRRWPMLFFGWVWYGVTLLPASGLLRPGQHGMADRYLYVPGIGLLAAIVWGVSAIPSGRWWRWAPALLGLVTVALGGQAHRQLGYWQNSLQLWEHAAAVTTLNAVTEINLGNALLEVGRDREAEARFLAAIEMEPNDARPSVNLAVMAQRRGDLAGAVRGFRRALALAPRDARIQSNLGALLDDAGEKPAARDLLESAVRIRPDLPEAQLNLGVVLAQAGELDRARNCFLAALRLRPDSAPAQQNLRIVEQAILAKNSAPGRP